MADIVVFSNPRSGGNRRNPARADTFARQLGGRGTVVAPTTLAELAENARECVQAGVETVLVNGGDGTLHKVLSAFVVALSAKHPAVPLADLPLPAVGLLKGGTVNTMARNLNQRVFGPELLQQVLAHRAAGAMMPVKHRRPLVVNGHYAGFLFGTGVLYRFMRMYDQGATPTPTKAVRLVMQVCLSTAVGGSLSRALFAPDAAVVTMDGVPWEPSSFASIALGTMDDIGLGFRVFHAASKHPDSIHALGFFCPPMSVLRALHRVPLGRPLNRPDIIDTLGRSFVIEGAAAKGFMIDGDFVDLPPEDPQVLRVDIGPYVPFLAPR